MKQQSGKTGKASSCPNGTKQGVTIDEESIVDALHLFAKEYQQKRPLAKHIVINGEAIKHLLTIYKAVYEISDWVGYGGLLEILLDNYRESFKRGTEGDSTFTPEGLSDKIEELFSIKTTLASMRQMEKAFLAFENIIDNR